MLHFVCCKHKYKNITHSNAGISFEDSTALSSLIHQLMNILFAFIYFSILLFCDRFELHGMERRNVDISCYQNGLLFLCSKS